MPTPQGRALADAGPSEEEYIEIVSVVCVVMVVDTFARGLGLTSFPLPEPRVGAPSGYRAPGARMHDAWISNVEPGDVVESDGALYDGPVAPPVVTALSLVPDASASIGIWRRPITCPIPRS